MTLTFCVCALCLNSTKLTKTAVFIRMTDEDKDRHRRSTRPPTSLAPIPTCRGCQFRLDRWREHSSNGPPGDGPLLTIISVPCLAPNTAPAPGLPQHLDSSTAPGLLCYAWRPCAPQLRLLVLSAMPGLLNGALFGSWAPPLRLAPVCS